MSTMLPLIMKTIFLIMAFSLSSLKNLSAMPYKKNRISGIAGG